MFAGLTVQRKRLKNVLDQSKLNSKDTENWQKEDFNLSESTPRRLTLVLSHENM